MQNEFIAFYPTNDLMAARHFYEGVLGLPLYKDQGACLIFRINESALIGFCAHKAMPYNPEDFFITLVTEDVDGLYETLTAAGAKSVEAPRVNERFSLYQALLRDPSGYTLEIQRFLA